MNEFKKKFPNKTYLCLNDSTSFNNLNDYLNEIAKPNLYYSFEYKIIGTIVSSVAQIRANTFALSNVLKKLE